MLFVCSSKLRYEELFSQSAVRSESPWTDRETLKTVNFTFSLQTLKTVNFKFSLQTLKTVNFTFSLQTLKTVNFTFSLQTLKTVNFTFSLHHTSRLQTIGLINQPTNQLTN